MTRQETARPCAGCGKPLSPEGLFLMRVEFIACPDPVDLPAPDPARDGLEIVNLLREIESRTEEELSDSVYSRDEYRVCAACRATLRARALLPARLPDELLDKLEETFR